jgi:hypothetical protein
MGVPRYANIVKIVMIRSDFGRGDLMNKLIVTQQQHKVINERPPELHTPMQALHNRVRRRREHVMIVEKKGTLQKSAAPN